MFSLFRVGVQRVFKKDLSSKLVLALSQHPSMTPVGTWLVKVCYAFEYDDLYTFSKGRDLLIRFQHV